MCIWNHGKLTIFRCQRGEVSRIHTLIHVQLSREIKQIKQYMYRMLKRQRTKFTNGPSFRTIFWPLFGTINHEHKGIVGTFYIQSNSRLMAPVLGVSLQKCAFKRRRDVINLLNCLHMRLVEHSCKGGSRTDTVHSTSLAIYITLGKKKSVQSKQKLSERKPYQPRSLASELETAYGDIPVVSKLQGEKTHYALTEKRFLKEIHKEKL